MDYGLGSIKGRAIPYHNSWFGFCSILFFFGVLFCPQPLWAEEDSCSFDRYGIVEGTPCTVDSDCSACAEHNFQYRKWVGVCEIGQCNCIPNRPYYESQCGEVIFNSDLLGDVNLDGGVNILDIVVLVNSILGTGAPPPCFERADVNHDFTLNILDIVGIVSSILGTGALQPFDLELGCGGDAAIYCEDCIFDNGICWAGPSNIYCCNEFLGGDCKSQQISTNTWVWGSFCSYNLCYQYSSCDEEIPYNGVDDDCDPTTDDGSFVEVPLECSDDDYIFDLSVDMDADCVLDIDDNCPETYNPDQEDGDADGTGDRCDHRICSNVYGPNGVCDDPNALNYCSPTEACSIFDQACLEASEPDSDPDCRPFNWDDSDCAGCIYATGECGCAVSLWMQQGQYVLASSDDNCVEVEYEGVGEQIFSANYNPYCAQSYMTPIPFEGSDECTSSADCPSNYPVCTHIANGTPQGINVCVNNECTCGDATFNPYTYHEPMCYCTWTSSCATCDGVCHPADFADCSYDENAKIECTNFCNQAWDGNNWLEARDDCENSFGPMAAEECVWWE